MKICLIERGLLRERVTGPSKHISQLSQALASSGQEVIIVCEMQRESDLPEKRPRRTDDDNPRVIQLRGVGHGHQEMLLGIMKSIRTEQPDVVHAQGYRNLTTDMAALASRVNNIPFVLSPRGSLSTYLRNNTDTLTPVAARLYDLLTFKLTLRTSRSVVVTCKSEMQEALDMDLNPEKVRLIPHGMIFPEIPSDRLSLDGHPSLLTVSRITPHRNILQILRSMKLILKEFPKAILYVAGDLVSSRDNLSDKRCISEIVNLANDENFGSNIKLLGGIYGEQLLRLYASCDVFLYASSYDNFGFGLLEAAYFGLPIVSTRVGIAPELIQDGHGGILISNHRPDTIAGATLDLLRDPQRMDHMSKHLKMKARHYSMEENAGSHLKLYRELLG